MSSDRPPIRDQQFEKVRRSGPPGGLLWFGRLLNVAGIGFFVLALRQLTSRWAPQWPRLTIGLAAGALCVCGGIATTLVWRRYRLEYEEFLKIACRHCGYDRRGLAADAKCPECGTTPTRG